jgi:uncharacterized membrane protein YfcA
MRARSSRCGVQTPSITWEIPAVCSGANFPSSTTGTYERRDANASIAPIRFGVGAAFGVCIGLVSSVLGVAGGELLIPTLVFIFGADIRTAGSPSLLIAVGFVLSGLWGYWRLKAIPQGRGVQRITAAMSAGSIFGAITGGLAVAYAPVEGLKLLLGLILLGTAVKTIVSHQ